MTRHTHPKTKFQFMAMLLVLGLLAACARVSAPLPLQEDEPTTITLQSSSWQIEAVDRPEEVDDPPFVLKPEETQESTAGPKSFSNSLREVSGSRLRIALVA